MSTVWEIAEASDSTALSDLPYSRLFRKILSLRGLQTEASVQKFLFPSLDDLHDPFLMKGIRPAAKRILEAVEKKEIIFIHGDYDVDGITGASLLVRTLHKLNGRFIPFLPNRKTDGYGVSRQAIDEARSRGASLLITVDCGITAFEETEEARAAGMDVIIIDHHRIHEGRMPNAFAVINPLQTDCLYPFKELSACGLAFKLAQALLGRSAFQLLDLAALSSVCDVAPLADENRILVCHGLKLLSERSSLGFRSLCEVAGLKRKNLAASDLGFILGPRINAAGRMSSPDTALRLLTSRDFSEAEKFALVLNEENKARQQEERALLQKAFQAVEREINFNRDRVIVVAGDGWHEGVIGIVAQRLVEHFHRPAFVIAFDGRRGKGSGRSVKGFHLFQGLETCASILDEFGGHELAAGLVIQKEHLEAFREKINEYAAGVSQEVFCRSVRIDLKISFEELSPTFWQELSLLEPFGAGNPRPVFLTRNLRTKRKPESDRKANRFASSALRWWVTDGTFTFEAVYRSRTGGVSFPESEPYALVYAPKVNVQEGIPSLTLEVRDIRIE